MSKGSNFDYDSLQNGDIEGKDSQERVMACISSSPFSFDVLRQASQIAKHLNAELYALYVEPPFLHQSNSTLSNLRKNFQLAEDLGAKILTVTAHDISAGVINAAFSCNITQMVVGKPYHSRWRDVIRGSVVDDIIRGCKGIGIFVVPGTPVDEETYSKADIYEPPRENIGWSLAFTILLVLLVSLTGKLFLSNIGLTNLCMLYFLPIIFASVRLGILPSILVALVSILSFDYLFVPPVNHFIIYDAEYLITFVVYVIAAFTIGNMADQLRLRMNEALFREVRTRALYDLTRGLSSVTDLNVLAKKVVNYVAETIDAEVVLYLPVNNKLTIAAASKAFSELVLGPNELYVAELAFNNSRQGKSGNNMVPSAIGFYLPLKTEDNVFGVLGIKPAQGDCTPDQMNLLEALAGLTALAIARLKLTQEKQNIKTLEESERLSTALFNSISHDMKTPLAAILAAVSSLIDDGNLYNSDQKKSLLMSIKNGASRMHRVVNNLLDMARLESGYLRLHSEWYDIQDIIGVTMRENQDILRDHHIIIEIPETLSMINVDFALIEQVFTNLLHNAVKYSPSQTEILIKVSADQGELRVSVADQGTGIKEGDEERIFDKFYCLHSPKNVTGTGLGLSICQGIIEAHKGRIWAENQPGGGARISFALPIVDPPPHSADNE
jgi:two-component system sensor histidine kinase KdpD